MRWPSWNSLASDSTIDKSSGLGTVVAVSRVRRCDKSGQSANVETADDGRDSPHDAEALLGGMPPWMNVDWSPPRDTSAVVRSSSAPPNRFMGLVDG